MLLIKQGEKLFQIVTRVSLYFFVPKKDRKAGNLGPVNQVFMEEYRDYLGCDAILVNQTHAVFAREITAPEIDTPLIETTQDV